MPSNKKNLSEEGFPNLNIKIKIRVIFTEIIKIERIMNKISIVC